MKKTQHIIRACSAVALTASLSLPITGLTQTGPYFDTDANLLHLPEVDAGDLGSFSVNLIATNTDPLRFEIQNATPIEATGQPSAMYRAESNDLSIFGAAVGNQFFNAELQDTPDGFEVTGVVEDDSLSLLNSAPASGSGAWNVVTGALKQVSVGAPQHVWGVNASDDIFRRDGNIWTNITGKLKQISVGCDGKVWGVNANNAVIRRDGSAWTQVTGVLTQISVGNELNVWGVNASNDIFRYDGSSGWTNITGKLTHVSAGCDGSVWGVNASNQVFRWDAPNNRWLSVSGSLKQVEVGDADNIWSLNSAGAALKWNRAQGNWTMMPGSQFKSISVAANGAAVWGTQTNDTILQNTSVLATPDAIQQRVGDIWNEVSGRLKQISVGSAAHIWGVNHKDDIFHRSGNNWVHIPGKLKQVSVSCNGAVWGVNARDNVFRRDGSNWTEMPGRLKQIAVGGSVILGINKDDNIFQWNGSGWVDVDGYLKQVAVGCDNTIWGVNANDDIFRRDGVNQWTNITGKLKQIHVGNANQVWGVNANDDIFQWHGSGWTHIGGKAKHVSVGNDGVVWGIKNLGGIPKPRIDLLGIDIDGDGTYERVLQITDYSGNRVLVYKPLAILYILDLFGVTITQAIIDSFSPVQQQALAAQNLPGLTSTVRNRNSGSSLVLGANFDINLNVGEISMSDLGLSSPTWTSANMTRHFGGGTDYTVAGSGALLSYQGFDNNITFFGVEGQGSVMAIDGFAPIPGGGVNAYVMQAGVEYGPAGSMTATAGNVNAQAYVNSQGMAVGAGATAVAVDGVGAGVGAGAAASWGQNGQYGFEMDVKFIKVGAYVSGDDAKPVFNNGTRWLRNAANNTAGWTTTAWQDTSGWFANTAGTGKASFMKFTDSTSNWASNAYNDGQNVSMSIIDGAESVTLQISNASTNAVNTVTNEVDSAIQSGANVATNVGNAVKDAGTVAGSTITSTADTVASGVSSGANTAGNAVVNFFCGLFSC